MQAFFHGRRWDAGTMICKIRAAMKQLPASLLFLLLPLMAGSPAFAEKADRNKPMNIEADALRYDEASQASVFTGRVVITKGTIVIRGTRVDVRQDAQGNQFGTVLGGADAPAYYRQKREGMDEFIEGEADSLEYDGRADTVRLLRNAQLRRLRGSTVADEMNGNLIVYDHTTDVFTVDGGVRTPNGAPVAGKSGTPGGRVRAVLTPRASGPEAAASSPAPAAPANLRPSVRIGEERK